MTTRRITMFTTTTKWATAFCVAVLLQAPDSRAQAPQVPPPQSQATATVPADTAAKHQAMMAEHEVMMAEMKAADERLDRLVATMASAPGAAKVDAMAAVVLEMVAQHRAMRHDMAMMMMMMRIHAAPPTGLGAMPIAAPVAAAATAPARAPVTVPVPAAATATVKAPMAADDPANGAKIYAAQKCSLCHRIGSTGGKMGPELSAVATTRSAAWLAKYLVDPKASDPKNKMPAVKVTGQDLKDLVAYLGTLKGQI